MLLHILVVFHWGRSWRSNTLAIWCEELTHGKRPWCWERLRAKEEVDGRVWGGWMASPTRWTWIWASSKSWQRKGKPGMLLSMGLQSQTWLSHKQHVVFLFHYWVVFHCMDMWVFIHLPVDSHLDHLYFLAFLRVGKLSDHPSIVIKAVCFTEGQLCPLLSCCGCDGRDE